MCLDEHLGLRFKCAKLGWLIGGLVYECEVLGLRAWVNGLFMWAYESWVDWLDWRGSDDWWA